MAYCRQVIVDRSHQVLGQQVYRQVTAYRHQVYCQVMLYCRREVQVYMA